jgi:tetratricopeptide (TPR) repeat protein
VAQISELDKLEARYRENPKGRNFAPLADAYRKAGLIDNAIDLCQEGLKLHPDYVSAHIVYGRCLIDKKDDPGAEQVYQKVLTLDPENIIALKVLAEIAERTSHFDDVVLWLTRLLAADPMNGDAAEALARAKGKAAAAKAAAPTEPIPEPAVRDSQLIDVDAAIAEAPTTAIGKPDFQIERAVADSPPPSAAADKRAQDLEVFDGHVDFNAVANAAAKADGIELQEEVELKADAAPIEGLARTQYEGSGMFRLEASEGLPPEPPPSPPQAPELEESMPSVDLPLIMPEEIDAQMARRTPPPRPAPPPPPQPPAAVALSDDDGAADTATLSQAEPVLTETMAELYLKQGHQEDALRVYAALLAQRPGDARLRAKVEQLSGPPKAGLAKAGSGRSAGEFLRRVLRGEAVAIPPAAPPAPPAPPPAPPVAPAPPAPPARDVSTLESAFSDATAEYAADAEAAGPTPGAPTLPAGDNISLDSVFGDGGRPSVVDQPAHPEPAPTSGGGGGGGGAGGFSFDDFFGAQQPGGGGGVAGGSGGGVTPSPASPKPAPRTSGRTTRQPEEDGDLDQFQAWLKGLKS